jgi:hypothetical protein
LSETGTLSGTLSNRINEHNQLTALKDNPREKYYQLRHSTYSNPSEFSRKFISLVAIPIGGRLEKDVITHRRLLCRIAETFFSISLMVFDSSSIYAKDLVRFSQEALPQVRYLNGTCGAES